MDFKMCIQMHCTTFGLIPHQTDLTHDQYFLKYRQVEKKYTLYIWQF